MKIAIITSLNGGVGRFISELTKELPKYEDIETIDLYSYIDQDRAIPIDFNSKVKVRILEHSPEKFLLKLSLSLPRLRDYDIIHHVSSSVAFILAYLASRLWNTPIISTTHGTTSSLDFKAHRYKIYSKIENALLKFTLHKSQRIIVMSRDLKKQIVRDYHIVPLVIYHGVDHYKFRFDNAKRKKIRDLLGIGENEVLVLFVGILHRHKDVMTLIDAIPKILEDIKNVKFLIIGRGEQYTEMIERVKSLNIEDFVLVKKRVKDIVAYYSAADVFVMPSLHERFGLVYVEAMACGLPVIAVNGHVVPEITGGVGLLFEPKNSDDLAEKIIELINNRKLQKKLKIKSLKRSKKFTWSEAARKYYDIYHMVLRS